MIINLNRHHDFIALFILLIIFFCILIALFFIFLGKYLSLWFQAFVSGTHVPFFHIIGMSIRKIPPHLIINAKINSFKAGLRNISILDLETHYLAGGHVNDVLKALIAADKADIKLSWQRATAIDLAGRDLFDAIKTSVTPKVIRCPANSEFICAVAKDGIELKCKALVTVKTNICQLVGGATEETIIARVGEGIVSAIGAAIDHQQVLEAPAAISKMILNMNLDKKTSFEIVSIDIASIMIGSNIGAKLRADKAESDMRVARAKAEERRAMAIAEEQENKAKIRKAEAQVPLAYSEALINNKLNVFDYQKLKNMNADTQMRRSISKEGKFDET